MAAALKFAFPKMVKSQQEKKSSCTEKFAWPMLEKVKQQTREQRTGAIKQ